MAGSFGAQSTIEVGGRSYEIFRLDALQPRYDVARLPYTLRILLENVLRHEGAPGVTSADAEAVATWVAGEQPSREISFTPARVLLQDFTGVPAIVDLAAMRDAMRDLGGDPALIDPQLPAELVIDHSVQVDEYATRFARNINAELEFQRNRERYAFLRWGQGAFDSLKVVPPNTGIVHQVNLEFLARVIETRELEGRLQAIPGHAGRHRLPHDDDQRARRSRLGCRRHRAEAAMLGEAVSMLVPQVVGFRLAGEFREGATATDLVLTVADPPPGRRRREVRRILRRRPSQPAARRPGHARQHVAGVRSNMRFLPGRRGDAEYLRLTGRDDERVALVEAYCKETSSGTARPSRRPTRGSSLSISATSARVSPAPAGPQDRVALTGGEAVVLPSLETFGVGDDGTHDKAVADTFPASDPTSSRPQGAGESSIGPQ